MVADRQQAASTGNALQSVLQMGFGKWVGQVTEDGRHAAA